MTIEELNTLMAGHPQVDAIGNYLRKKSGHLLLTGLNASARYLILSRLSADRPMLLVMDSQDEAQYAFADLQTLGANVLYFPTSRRRRQGVDEAMQIQRTEVLTYLDRNPEENWLVVTYPEALAESAPDTLTLRRSTVVVKQGDKIAQTTLSNMLIELGFERVDFVYQPGQYAVRGGIMDVYSYSHDDPYRLDFFGDEIDSLRTFDIETQLSKERVETAALNGVNDAEETNATLVDYLPKNTVWGSNDFAVVQFKVESLEFRDKQTIEIGAKSFFPTFDKIAFDILPQPIFHKNFELLVEDLHERLSRGYRVYILADQKKQTDRLQAIFEDIAANDNSEPVRFTPIDKTLHAGFVDNEAKICCYTDHEIFERYHRVQLRSENARRGKAVLTLKEINQLRLGDYVVHSDHGIGQFGGLVTTTVNGKPQEMIRLTYRDGDTIFVSIHNLHRIAKYKGREGAAPTISKLGSGAWERLKERTKDKVKDIARDLIQLYATRKGQKGFAYTPDGYMQHELEASFLYEDTPDQAKATIDVKRDMESPMPMDRLICGDVGFGKTEIAMRAAFKAATDGKQVAVLVPTTVLALQHYNTFTERFKDFPVKIEYLSRAKGAKETADVLERLEKGEIDILIGTHKLVGKTVRWKDLGLLIIDEEQKFGVAVKEKLKSLRTNVDVLTLTATPIPRTLQFSLLGARDLSVMTTAPQNRYPVQTEVITPEDEDIIQEAIELEMSRNGQVFIVNNRIEMLDRIAHKIQRLCPQARIVTAHGQMPTDEMEKRLEDFINYDYDVLISTTIIESGVDIPNVNSIVIFSAQHYGLADLHQLRGRVGRSNRKAYCYLVAPERELLTEDARRRLDAISTFAELGAGFHLAMQDLDIRGAGNLLGAEQSGFIADLGYETYQRILNEAVTELKEELNLFDNAPEDLPQTTNWAADSQLESDLQLCFPQDYVENISERITLYKELDSLRDEGELTAYTKRLIDRFGPLPEQAEELLNVVRLRWLCCKMGIEKIYLKGERMTMYFITNNDKYWQSEVFGKILLFATQRLDRCRVVEDVDKQGQKTGKRHMTIMQVRTLGGALHLLSKIYNE
ncbi:MAG: transcription-repair coupling factor [Paludibacteraceae bacterium]|nr:transcription-repair coupling factor [Paludibacteraceae bacterium]MBR0297226.1 transcription-repair coupling factor [Paludibacteraceae bacterium]